MGKPDGGDRRLGRTVTHGLAIFFFVPKPVLDAMPAGEKSLTVLE
jgi:hypothetical protein